MNFDINYSKNKIDKEIQKNRNKENFVNAKMNSYASSPYKHNYLYLLNNGKFRSVNIFKNGVRSIDNLAIIKSLYLDIDFLKTDAYKSAIFTCANKLFSIKEKSFMTRFSINEDDDIIQFTKDNFYAVSVYLSEAKILDKYFTAQVRDICVKEKIPFPSRINNSGSGYHLYWDIAATDSFISQKPDATGASSKMSKMYINLEKQLYNRFKHLGADKNALDVSRVLRLEKSINQKVNKKVYCVYKSKDLSKMVSFAHILPYTYEEYLEYKKITQKQIDLVNGLKSEGYIDEGLDVSKHNKFTIMDIINEAKSRKPATTNQKLALDRLKVRYRNGITFKEADNLLQENGFVKNENHLYSKLLKMYNDGYVKEGNRAYFYFSLGIASKYGDVAPEKFNTGLSEKEWQKHFTSGQNAKAVGLTHRYLSETFELPEGYLVYKGVKTSRKTSKKVKISPQNRVNLKKRIQMDLFIGLMEIDEYMAKYDASRRTVYRIIEETRKEIVQIRERVEAKNLSRDKSFALFMGRLRFKVRQLFKSLGENLTSTMKECIDLNIRGIAIDIIFDNEEYFSMGRLSTLNTLK